MSGFATRKTRRFKAALALAAALLAVSCVSQPDYYAPPEQRRPSLGPDTSRLKHYIRMNDPAAPDHILRDISETVEGDAWRWTRQRPMLRFVTPKTDGLRLVMDFAFNGETMKETGPVTIRFLVNGHLLDTVKYETEGAQRFEKAVPKEWLAEGEDAVVAAELDKVWVSPQDGNKLGVILSGAGFLD
ncbi:MAG: hypothetical protein R2762_15660 [Bryobacteraceae bacterium]